jgi:hypothetical protein
MTRIESIDHGELHGSGPRRWLAAVAGWVLRRCWYIDAPVVLMLQASPAQVVEKLNAASKPSVSRLDLRNLYVNGRRYFVQPREGGFRLMTTSKIPWRARQRTSSATVMNGKFAPYGNGGTRIQMRVRVSPVYTLTALILPLFMTSILVYVPWPPGIIALVLATLFGLAWAGQRLSAALEANDMIWFVQKALEDFVPAEIEHLGAEAPVYYDESTFTKAWDRFYREHRPGGG